MLLRQLRHGILDISDWEIVPGESLCVLGGNASGKSLLAAILAGEITPEAGSIENAPRRPALLSFESLQTAYERELANDDTDFLDRIDYGSTGLEILLESGCDRDAAEEAAERFGLSHLIHAGCRQFSTGEMRRIHLLATVLKEPDLLLLDEPYDGLDSQSREQIDAFLAELAAAKHTCIVFASLLSDVPAWCSQLALLHAGRLLAVGRADEILHGPAFAQFNFSIEQDPIPSPPANIERIHFDPLLRLVDCAVRYSEGTLFENLSWTLAPGQHTLITGPNGCGKSTLLGLISGDHPQCYTNDIRIFGYQRGNGESIWQIKEHLGIVSSSLHRDYRAAGSLETVVVSGFYDSIGLYHEPSAVQRRLAQQWLSLFRMNGLEGRPFRSLSYGQQRLGLIARALVKQPPLLVLDEPTQGLDDPNRHLVLSCLESLAGLQHTTLLFVSHRQDERLALFQRHLKFLPDPTGAARYRIEQSSL